MIDSGMLTIYCKLAYDTLLDAEYFIRVMPLRILY